MEKTAKPKINIPAKATVWYLASGIIGKAIGILATPFFTRLLSEEEYGTFTLYMTVLGGASIICSSLSSGSAVYSGFVKFKEGISNFKSSVLFVSSLFSVTICLLLFALIPFFDIPRVLFIPLSLQIICDSIMAVFYSYSRFNYRYVTVCAMTMISYILPPALSLFMLTAYGGGYKIRIFALLAVSISSALFALLYLLRERGRVSLKMCRSLIRSAAPLLPHSISGAVVAQADKLIISFLLGRVALAKYSVASSIGISGMFLVNSLGGALNPWIIRRLGSNEIQRISDLLSPTFAIICSASLFITAIAPEGIGILAPREYYDAVYSVLPIAMSCISSFILSSATVGLVFAGKGRYTVYLSFISSFWCIALGLLFVNVIGYVGGAIALLITQSVGAVIAIGFLAKIGLGDMFDMKKCIYGLIFTLAWGLVILLLYPFPALRVLALIPPALTLVNSLLNAKDMIFE